MQQRLGVAARLFQFFEHQVTRRLVGHRRVEVPGHRLVERVAGVLPIHSGHALEHFLEVFLIQDSDKSCKGTMCRLKTEPS